MMGKTKRYFAVRLRSAVKSFYIVLAITLVIAIAASAVVFAVLKHVEENDDGKVKFIIGVVGDMSQPYLEFGVSTLQNTDSSRFSLEFRVMEEDEAESALSSGRIGGFLRIPDDFVEAAGRGDYVPMEYVTAGNSAGTKDAIAAEIAGMAEKMVVESQRGINGAEDYLTGKVPSEKIDDLVGEMSFEYVDYILLRNENYTLTSVGSDNGMSVGSSYFCSFAVLFLLLWGITGAPLLVKKDLSLVKLMSSKGIGSQKQVLCEYGAYFAVVWIVFLCVCTVIGVMVSVFDVGKGYFDGAGTVDFILFAVKLIPLAAMIASVHILLYECVSGVVNGVLLQFIVAIAASYISGCFYPVYFFPEFIQKIAGVLPVGVALSLAKGVFGDSVSASDVILILAYSVMFVFFTSLVRRMRIRGEGK